MLPVFLRFVLRSEILVVTGHAVFVRAAMDLDMFVEVAVRRWRGRLPFERGRFPWVVAIHFATALDAPEEVDDEWNLRHAQKPRGVRDVYIHVDHCLRKTDHPLRIGVSGATVPHAAVHAGEALCEHGLEHEVHENEGQEEMDLAPELVHRPASDLRVPIIDAGEEREDRSRRNDVMEMRDD